MILAICIAIAVYPVAAVLYGAVQGFFDPVIPDSSGFVEIIK